MEETSFPNVPESATPDVASKSRKQTEASQANHESKPCCAKNKPDGNPIKKGSAPKDQTVVSLRFEVASQHIGCVAGRKRQNLERIQKQFSVKVILPPRGGTTVCLEGSPSNCAKAKKDIMNHLPVTITLTTDPKMAAFLTALRETRLKQLEQAYHVQIELEGNQVFISGFPFYCNTVKKKIETLLRTAEPGEPIDTRCLPVKGRSIGRIIGAKGRNIRRLKSEHGVSVVLGTGEVFVSGPKSACAAAVADIQDLIFGHNPNSNYYYDWVHQQRIDISHECIKLNLCV